MFKISFKENKQLYNTYSSFHEEKESVYFKIRGDKSIT